MYDMILPNLELDVTNIVENGKYFAKLALLLVLSSFLSFFHSFPLHSNSVVTQRHAIGSVKRAICFRLLKEGERKRWRERKIKHASTQGVEKFISFTLLYHKSFSLALLP